MDKSTLHQFAAVCIAAIALASCAPSGTAVKGVGETLDPLMGDWQGHRVTDAGKVIPVAVQAIALGGQSYRVNVYTKFDRREEALYSVDARLDGDRLVLPNDPGWQATLSDGKIWGVTPRDEARSFGLVHTVRVSPALGAKPPAGAVVLFDGTGFDAWEQISDKPGADKRVAWKLVDGAMEVKPGTGSIITKRTFSNFQLHLEFQTPFMPEAREQNRGNSGLYLQGRYEVQVLDSYGLKGEDNECGGIYKVAAPRVNMCAPPGQWQSYDVTFHAPRFDNAGTKTRSAMITVLHNGIAIHENLEIPGPTGGALDSDVQRPGGIELQDHGNLVQYRNIWLVEAEN